MVYEHGVQLVCLLPSVSPTAKLRRPQTIRAVCMLVSRQQFHMSASVVGHILEGGGGKCKSGKSVLFSQLMRQNQLKPSFWKKKNTKVSLYRENVGCIWALGSCCGASVSLDLILLTSTLINAKCCWHLLSMAFPHAPWKACGNSTCPPVPPPPAQQFR